MIDFNKIVEQRLKKIESVLNNKAKEYSSGTDRLHNFRVASRVGCVEETMVKSLEGMMRKHLVSVYDIINNPEKCTKELIDEKIGDLINYLILLEAILLEEYVIEKKYKVGGIYTK